MADDIGHYYQPQPQPRLPLQPQPRPLAQRLHPLVRPTVRQDQPKAQPHVQAEQAAPRPAAKPLAEAAASLRIAAETPAQAQVRPASLTLPVPPAARPAPESAGLRAIALFNEAKAAGEDHVTTFLQTLEVAVKQAREIVDGKEVYPAGVRDICEKLVEYSASRAQAIVSIMRPDSPHRPAAPFETTAPEALGSLEEADLAAEMETMAEPRSFGRRV